MGELRVESVPCFLHSKIQGEIIPDAPENFPFTAAFLDRLLETCPVVVDIIENEEEMTNGHATGWISEDMVGLRRISRNHGRSYELCTSAGDALKPLAIWADEYENAYSSLSLKGNNFSSPYIMKSLTAPSEYIPHGFQETDSFLRVVRASRMMAEAGIGTERIIRVAEPKLIRAPKVDPEHGTIIDEAYEYVPQIEGKRRMLLQHWQHIADRPDAIEEFKKASKAINEMSFFVTLRAMSVGSRILDLCGPPETFIPQVEHIFRVLDPLIEHEEGKGPLDATNKEHLDWFFTFYLPTFIGANLAKLHNLGLMHTFPTTGNINALGDLIDLDSVKGAPLGLGDAELTEEDFFSDLDYFMHDQSNIHEMESLADNFLKVLGDDFSVDEHDRDVIENRDDLDESGKLKEYFLGAFKARVVTAYIQERFNMGDTYAITEQEMHSFMDFIELEIREGEGYGYVDFIRLILEHQLKDTSYLDLADEACIHAVTEAYARWGENTTVERTRNIIMSQLVVQNAEHFDHSAELELNIYYATMAALSKDERLFRHNNAGEHINSEIFQKALDIWVDEHMKTDAAYARDTNKRAITLSLREYISREAYRNFGSRPKNPELAVSFFSEYLAPELGFNDGVRAEVHSLLLDDTMCSIWAKVGRAALEAKIAPSDRVTLIRHTAEKMGEAIDLRSNRDMRLQQIFHDGELIEDLDIQMHGKHEAFGGGATLSFKPHPQCTYLAWTMLDTNEKTLHLYMQQR